MNHYGISIKDIEPIAPFSQGSTERFLTGHWSSRKPIWVDKMSPCREMCPIGVDIARAFYLASRGEYDEALKIYRQDNPLPGICGRVCYHPCELGCNRKEFDEAVNIRGFERFLSDNGKADIKDEIPARSRKEQIAVIGSGPAGLSAAYHLARLGYPVTIYEALPEPGGMLRYGIPEYRLPKDILRREIGYIQQLGVEIKTGVRVGKDISLVEIKRTHQAVFIAAGAHGGMRLGVEGEGLPGVMEGIRFLRNVNLDKKNPPSPPFPRTESLRDRCKGRQGGFAGERIEIGKRVAVIGGGNTAIDCARTARRIGGKDTTIIYRRSRAEMPALPEDVASVEAEGIKIVFLAAPNRLISEKGRFSGIECIRMELGAPDESGRPQPVRIKGSEFIVPVDTVIAAVGQAPEAGFVGEIGLTLSKRGLIECSSETGATNIEGVFAGGDSAGVKAFVADAIASGKMGALAISCYLEGKDIKKEFLKCQIGDRPSFSFQHFMDPVEYVVDLKKVASFDKINTLCFPHGPRNNNPEQLAPEEGIKTFEEVTGGIPLAKMPVEIYRCFKCGKCTQCDLCFYLCPDVSILKAGGGYSVRADYCKGCSICATTCPGHVIEIEMGGAG